MTTEAPAIFETVKLQERQLRAFPARLSYSEYSKPNVVDTPTETNFTQSRSALLIC